MIPVLNWNEFQTDPQAFVTRLGKACRETGFFLLSDHGVPQNLIEGTFAAGDALSGIAIRFGVTIQELQLWNDIKNPNLIYAGNTLTIYPRTLR